MVVIKGHRNCETAAKVVLQKFLPLCGLTHNKCSHGTGQRPRIVDGSQLNFFLDYVRIRCNCTRDIPRFDDEQSFRICKRMYDLMKKQMKNRDKELAFSKAAASVATITTTRHVSIISKSKKVSHKITSNLGSCWHEKNEHSLRKRKSRANEAQEGQHQFIYQQQPSPPQAIQEIEISSENANYLEYKPTNKKKNNPSNNSVLKINNVNVKEPPIHPVTDTSSDQSRPRHFTTPEMIKRLDPICLDRTIGPHEYPVNDRKTLKSSADVVKVTFKDSGRANYVLYASDRSVNNLLKKAYQLWNRYEGKIRRLLNTMPPEALIKDDLAGGCYACFGLSTLLPGPKNMPKREINTGRPYLRQSSIYSEVARLFKLYGEILGLISNAMAELLPEVYMENKNRAIQDFAFPTPEMQCGDGNILTEDYKYWYCNQVIARVMGRNLGKMEASNMPVAMHHDSCDEPMDQLLVYSPCDNHVRNSDLLIFERKHGGPCYRVNTSIKNTLTIVLMNSAEQLHASAIEEECDPTPSCSSYSIRFIHYVRPQIKRFGKKVAEKGNTTGPWLSVKPKEDHTKALKYSELKNDMLVASNFGADNSRDNLQARVTNKLNGKFDLTWLIDDTLTKKWTKKVYHHNCIKNKKKCQRCWIFPTDNV